MSHGLRQPFSHRLKRLSRVPSFIHHHADLEIPPLRTTVWGWQLTTASPAYLGATIIQALAILNYPDTYVPQQWHGTLIYWAIILIGFIVNVGFAKWLPKLEGFL